MKTKEYVDKYRLNLGTKFNHNEFISDLTSDLLSLLEVGKGNENIKGFNNAVNAIKMKFDAINNKTVGNIEKLWNYFFATVVVKLKKELFPEFVKNEEEERQRRKRQYEQRKDWENEGFYDWLRILMFFGLQRTTIPKDSFELLGLSENANMEDLKTAYRKLSLIHHPDKGGSNEYFIKLTEAKNKVAQYISKAT